MLTYLQSLVQHCLAWEWTATHRCYSHTHADTHRQRLLYMQTQIYKNQKKIECTLKITTIYLDQSVRVCLCLGVQSTYLCIWTFLVCLCRTVWTCKTEWPQRPRGCVWEASAPGWHAAWSTREGRKGGNKSQYTNTCTWSGSKTLLASGQCKCYQQTSWVLIWCVVYTMYYNTFAANKERIVFSPFKSDPGSIFDHYCLLFFEHVSQELSCWSSTLKFIFLFWVAFALVNVVKGIFNWALFTFGFEAYCINLITGPES